jgi:hypothetical protein
LTKACALLRFKQRERTRDGKIVAAQEDYSTAVMLAAGPLRAAAGGISTAAREFYDRLKSRFGPGEFTTTSARESETAKRRTVYEWMNELCDARFIEQTKAGKGKVPAKWKRTAKKPDAVPEVVPPPSIVFADDSHRTHAREPEVDDR